MVEGHLTLQETFLTNMRNREDNLCVYFVNGIKLQGCLVDFDQYCIKLKNANGVEQMIYKNAISTLIPTK